MSGPADARAPSPDCYLSQVDVSVGLSGEFGNETNEETSKSRDMLYPAAGALGQDELWSAWSPWSGTSCDKVTGRDAGAATESLCVCAGRGAVLGIWNLGWEWGWGT